MIFNFSRKTVIIFNFSRQKIIIIDFLRLKFIINEFLKPKIYDYKTFARQIQIGEDCFPAFAGFLGIYSKLMGLKVSIETSLVQNSILKK